MSNVVLRDPQHLRVANDLLEHNDKKVPSAHDGKQLQRADDASRMIGLSKLPHNSDLKKILGSKRIMAAAQLPLYVHNFLLTYDWPHPKTLQKDRKKKLWIPWLNSQDRCVGMSMRRIQIHNDKIRIKLQ